MIIMPKKIDWDNVLNKAWLYTKVFFATSIICIIAYTFGTFNPNKVSTKKANADLEKYYLNKIKDLDLREPEFTYNNDIQFVRAMHKCIDYINFTTPRMNRVPYEMVVAQAALESGWGTSRFATEGNALFGVRTWDDKVPQMKPLGIPNAKFGVKKYKTKCQSVADVIDILNRHPAYEEFRVERTKQLNSGVINYSKLVNGLKAWSTNDQYSIIILDKIKSLNAKK